VPTDGYIDEPCEIKVKTTDPEANAVRYWVEFGDGNNSGWSAFYPSGQEISVFHTYTKIDTFFAKAKAQDTPGYNESNWSDSSSIVIKVGPGACWVADYGGSQGVKLGVGGSVICRYFNGSAPTPDSCHPEFKDPLTLAVDPTDGCVWIACSYQERIWKLSPKGKYIFHKLCGSGTNPSTPCIDNNGDCWVCFSGTKEFVKFDRNTGAIKKRIPDTGIQAFEMPIAISLDADSGWIWAAEYTMGTNGHVSRFDTSGNLIPPRYGGFNPLWVEVDPVTHYCWVADQGNGSVAKISPAGNIQRFGGFLDPPCLSIDPATAVWVSDPGHSQIAKLSYDGAELFRVGVVDSVTAVEVDLNDGSCWASDASNSRIVKLSSSGNMLFEVNHSFFITPMGLSVNPNPDP
jgi:streptogramin lyase